MTSQPIADSSTSPLDGYLHGIKEEFDRLNEELGEVRKQRDEYKTNYKNQEKELREFIINHKNQERDLRAFITNYQNQEKALRELISSLLYRLNEKDENCEHCRGDPITELADNNISIRSPASSPSSESFFNAPDRMDSTGDLKEISSVEEDQDRDVRDAAISVKNEGRNPSGFASPLIGSNMISTNKAGNSGWDVKYNGDTEIGLKLDLAHELTPESQDGTYLAFSSDGKYLATASKVVRIFDVNTGRQISVMRDLYRQSDEVYYHCLGFSPNNNYLATGEYGRVTIWIISQRRVRNKLRVGDYVFGLDFSPNGQHLVTCSLDRTVRIWRLRDGFSRVLTGLQWQHLPMAARFSPDGRYVVSGNNFGEILIWNVRSGRLVARWKGHSEPFADVSDLMFTPDGKGLLIASWDKMVVWDIAWLRSLGVIMEGEHWQDVKSTVTETSRFADHTDNVCTISISFDGKWIASGADDKTVRIWNADDGTLQCTLHCPAEVRSTSFSPDGTYLAIGGLFPQVTIWECSNLITCTTRTAVLPL